MEINTASQQNINQEIIPKRDFKDSSSVSLANKDGGENVASGIEQCANNQNLSKDEAGILVQNQNMSFKEQLTQLGNQNSIYDFSFDIDFEGVYNFNVNETDEKDINFFLDIIEKNKDKQQIQNLGIIPLVSNTANVDQKTDVQSLQATEKIMQIVETASKTGKPVRIDFDNQITVVLRVDSEGKINAQFYPGDKAAEEYLKNNMQSLRNTFDEKNILYSYLDYRQNKGNNGKERKDKQ